MRRTQAVIPASMMGQLYPGGAGSSGVSAAGRGGSPAGLPQQQMQALQAQQQQMYLAGPQGPLLMSPQQLAMPGAVPWVFTGAGWVPPMPDQAMMLPMQPGPGLPQQLMPAGPGGSAVLLPGGAGMQQAGMGVPPDALAGLAASLQNLSTQDQQGLACTMLGASSAELQAAAGQGLAMVGSPGLAYGGGSSTGGDNPPRGPLA